MGRRMQSARKIRDYTFWNRGEKYSALRYEKRLVFGCMSSAECGVHQLLLFAIMF